MPSLIPTQPFRIKLMCHWPGNHTCIRDCKPWRSVNFWPFKGNSIVINLAILCTIPRLKYMLWISWTNCANSMLVGKLACIYVTFSLSTHIECSDILRNPEIRSNQGIVSYQCEQQCGYRDIRTSMGDLTLCYACVCCMNYIMFGKPFKLLTRMACSAEFLDWCNTLAMSPGNSWLYIAMERDSLDGEKGATCWPL